MTDHPLQVGFTVILCTCFFASLCCLLWLVIESIYSDFALFALRLRQAGNMSQSVQLVASCGEDEICNGDLVPDMPPI